jgi:hypothetical protein
MYDPSIIKAVFKMFVWFGIGYEIETSGFVGGTTGRQLGS